MKEDQEPETEHNPFKDREPIENELAVEILNFGEIEIVGRMPWASNGTFLTNLSHDKLNIQGIYKPGKGERTTYKKGSDKTIVTGRDIFYYNSDGKPVGKQTQRSKRGPIFGLDSTFQYPPKVVKCFENGTKP